MQLYAENPERILKILQGHFGAFVEIITHHARSQILDWPWAQITAKTP
jgi:hypothetical protein